MNNSFEYYYKEAIIKPRIEQRSQRIQDATYPIIKWTCIISGMWFVVNIITHI